MDALSTIAAVSTPQGQGAISLLRLSGPDSRDILSRCWRGRPVTGMPPRRACFGHILRENGEELDDVLATFFPGPASYTGEDSLEITCHGSPLITGKILERLISCGAVPAAPGEFTQRAFLNGRLDLTQAEAVMDVLAARTDLALKAAREQLDGALGHRIKEQTDLLLAVLAHIEAYIDFPDEDIAPDTMRALLDRLSSLSGALRALLDTADQGRLLREGIRTVLAGPPNVGKSSLLNLLLGYERAIVSDTPGTTRDTLEESVVIGGFTLRLIDTAGLRHSDDHIEREGIRRTTRAMEGADLLLEVADASLPRPSRLPAPADAPHKLLLLNKCDRGIHPDWETAEGVRLSCLTGDGLKELTAAIAHCLGADNWLDSRASLVSVNARHQHLLKQALNAVEQAAASLSAGESPEFIALDLREALTHLGEITGKVDTEDVLGKIFSTFCIGK